MQMPMGTISQIIVKSGTEGAWQRLEQGDITLSEFVTAFSKECSQKVILFCSSDDDEIRTAWKRPISLMG